MLQTLNITPARPPGLPVAGPDLVPKGRNDFWIQVVRPSRDDPKERKVVTELHQRITEWRASESEFLTNSEIELEFLSGRHWIDNVAGQARDRQQELWAIGRSAFTIDLLTPSVDLIVNQIRINKTTPVFVPLSNGATARTAEVRQGLYRQIDRQSKGAVARETAYQLAVSVGKGYWKVVIEDEDGPSLGRRIAIRRIDNLYSVAIDPTCAQFDYSDASWGYTFDDLWKDEFVSTYGDLGDVSLDVTGQDMLPDEVARNWWYPKDKVKVGEYWRRVWRRREAWRIRDPEAQSGYSDVWADEAPTDAQVILSKQKMDDYLEWRKITGSQTLEKRIWPGRLIPIIVCIGREVFRGKKPKIYSGLVKPGMDPSRINDYMTSRTVDEVALSPLPHMFSATGQLNPDQKRKVAEINKHPWSNIEHTVIEDGAGRALPPPFWASPSPNTAAVVQAKEVSKDDLQRVLNTYSPQLGRQQGDQSGNAIRQIKDSGDVSHAAFPDNYERACNYEGEVVNELMDYVYTDKQAITITNLDMSTEQVLINQEYVDKKTGKTVSHIFGSGKYGIAVSTAPKFASQMKERVSEIMQLAGAIPAEIVKVMDLLVEDMGVPGWQRYADRWRPPGFNSGEDGPDAAQLTQIVQQYEQQAQQADALIKQLLAKVQQLGSQQMTKFLEIASKERIAAANNMANILAAEAKAGNMGAHSVLMAQIEVILKQLDQALDVQTATATAGLNAPAAPGGPATPNPEGALAQPAALPTAPPSPAPQAPPTPQ